MKRDVRVDIIYFCTPADWRFESELHGDAYDLRLLTQTASTRAEAVHALGRAVGRSEIVLIIGGFYGEIYLPATVAAAIGFSCQRVGLAGARREDTLIFPAGSVPFALDGRLRGASVSSGPQTIFFLDEDRAGRIRLLREAILPQILSRYALEDAAQTPSSAAGVASLPGSKDSGSAANAMDKPSEKSKDRVDTPPREASAASAAPEALESERVILTPRRSVSRTGRELPHIPQPEELSATEKQILEELPRLHLSPEREGKTERLPEKLSFPEREPESLPRTHVELKDIRIAAAAPEPKEDSASALKGERPKKEARAASLPPVEMEKMRLPTEDTPEPGDWIQPEALSDGEDFLPPEEETLAVGRVAKIVIAVIAVVLLLLALWSGYSYFASDSGETAPPSGWTAEAEKWGGTVW